MRNIRIAYRFFFYFIIFAALLVLGVWLLQSQIMPSFYYHRQVRRINSEITELDALIGALDMNQTTINLIQDFEARTTSHITVYAQNGHVLYDFQGAENLRSADLAQLSSGAIERLTYDGAMAYLQIYVLHETYIYRFEIPFQNLSEVVAIINALYGYVVIIALLLALLLAFLFSRQISRPLVRLNDIARQMSKLDFDIRWIDDRDDEIGQLGETLNTLTTELGNAFAQLERELEHSKELERLRKSFVSNVSHELQTPLAVILGITEAIEDQLAKTPDEQKRYLEMLRTETRKMSGLAHDMLDLSQLESGRFTVSKKPFDYHDLLEQVTAKFRHMKSEGKQNLVLEIDPDVKTVNADEIRIGQVLDNLLQNAYQHAPLSSTITLKAWCEAGYLHTSITNEGPLIEARDIDHIFDSFYKGEHKKGGTGLGLAIVKQIVLLHQGSYQAENIGKGVKFTFSMPL